MSFAADNISTEARLVEREAPATSPVMYQRWLELLFVHWSVSPEIVAKTLPPGLKVDTFGGKAWIGIVPFRMANVRPRFLPAVPGISNFPELNLRTYVVDSAGRPGVWFYSLDTPKRLPNWIARTFFHLNYRFSRMRVECSAGQINYCSELRLKKSWGCRQEYSWKRVDNVFMAEPKSLEFFLVERYRLFAYDSGRKSLLTGCVHHEPYPLQRVDLAECSKQLFATNNLPEPEGAPQSVLASAGVDVNIYPMEGI